MSRPRSVWAGAGLLFVLVTVAVLAPFIAPHDPHALSGDSLERPSPRHLLGTNDIGQDIFSQLLWGGRASLVVAVGAAGLTVVVGTVVGMVAGLLGGTTDTVAMRVADIFLAVPNLPLLILVAALAGPRRSTLIVAIALVIWPIGARVVRSQMLSLRQRGFVEAARGLGAGPLYIARRHLLPALAPIVVAGFVNVAAVAVLLEASLAFLGLGDPTSVSWGLVLHRAVLQQSLYFTPLWTWWVLPAGLAITLAVSSFTLLGVGLEPRFNPRVARRL